MSKDLGKAELSLYVVHDSSYQCVKETKKLQKFRICAEKRDWKVVMAAELVAPPGFVQERLAQHGIHVTLA